MREFLQKMYEKALDKLTRNARSLDDMYLEDYCRDVDKYVTALRDEVLRLEEENKTMQEISIEREGSLLELVHAHSLWELTTDQVLKMETYINKRDEEWHKRNDPNWRKLT